MYILSPLYTYYGVLFHQNIFHVLMTPRFFNLSYLVATESPNDGKVWDIALKPVSTHNLSHHYNISLVSILFVFPAFESSLLFQGQTGFLKCV